MTMDMLGPVQLGTAVLPVTAYRLIPGVMTRGSRVGHHQYPGQQTVFGARPSVAITVPFKAGYDALVGFTAKRFTAADLYFCRIDAATGAPASGAAHRKYELADGAYCLASMLSWGVSQGGLAMAEIQLDFAAAAGAAANPFGPAAALAALPTLSSTPDRYTLGPVSIAGSAQRPMSIRGQCGNRIVTRASTGERYTTELGWLGADPVLQVGVDNPDAVIQATTMDSVGASTTTTVQLLEVDSDDEVGSTGLTITCRGRVSPEPIAVQVDGLASGGLAILPASTDGLVHPWSVA